MSSKIKLDGKLFATNLERFCRHLRVCMNEDDPGSGMSGVTWRWQGPVRGLSRLAGTPLNFLLGCFVFRGLSRGVTLWRSARRALEAPSLLPGIFAACWMCVQCWRGRRRMGGCMAVPPLSLLTRAK